jgi:molybdate transport system substrate-binding protein
MAQKTRKHMMEPLHMIKYFRFLLVMLTLSNGVVQAADLKVLTAGAFKPVLVALQTEFEKQTGHRLLVENDTAGGLQKRIAVGESFDLLVITPAALTQLAQQGKILEGSAQRLARVAIGVAVKQGDPSPDISSVANFQRALLAARSVAYIDPASGGSSGIYLSGLFEQWGLKERINAKAVLVPGGLVAERLLNGQADLAVHQISEILAVPGAALVGPIPPEIQSYTVYSGAISSASAQAAAAKQLIEALRSPAATALLQSKGMERP